MPIDPADLLTPEELAVRLKVKRSFISERLRSHRDNPIPHMKLGRYLRFHWPTVSAWLESTATQSRKGRLRN